MKFKKILILTTIFLQSISCFSQDELDEIFDDGDKESKLYLGTSINTLMAGVPNIYLDFFPIERFKLNAGIGIIPFNKHRDYTYSIPIESEEIPPVYENLSGGTFYSLGLALTSAIDLGLNFDYYYYIMLRNRKFSILNDSFDVKQSRISLGTGYKIGLPQRFNLDILVGIATGSEKILIGNTQNVNSKERGVGLELSFGLNYAL